MEKYFYIRIEIMGHGSGSNPPGRNPLHFQTLLHNKMTIIKLYLYILCVETSLQNIIPVLKT